MISAILNASEKIQDRFENFSKAMLKLTEAYEIIQKDSAEIYRDAFFQRYEFCVELAWKLLKDILEFEKIEVKTPRQSIKEATRVGLIDDFYIWDKMLDKRNFSSHNYDETAIVDMFPTMYNVDYPQLVLLHDNVKIKYKI